MAVRPHSPLSVVPGPAVRKIKPSTAAPSQAAFQAESRHKWQLGAPRTSFSENTLKSSVCENYRHLSRAPRKRFEALLCVLAGDVKNLCPPRQELIRLSTSVRQAPL